MNFTYLTSLFVVCSALLFQWRKLNIKKIQEQGLSPWGVLYYQKFALVPAVVLLVFTFKIEYVKLLLQKEFIFLFILMSLFWIVQELFGFIVLGSASNLSFLNAFKGLLTIPIYLLLGFFFNGDVPNIYTGVALILLAVALLVKPQTAQAGRSRLFQHGMFVIIALLTIETVVDGFNSAAFRFILQNINATLFVVAVSITAIMILLNLFFLFKPITPADKIIVRQHHYLAYSIPLLWFLASIPEGYGYYYVPIYTVMAISALTFALDVWSDVKNKRIKMNIRTGSFVLLVIISIVFSVASLKN